MKTTKKTTIGLLLIFAFCQNLLAGDTLRIASYNLLNFPGSDVTTRIPYFRAVVYTMNPDVLVVQEMLSQTGVNTFLNDVMNVYQPGLYSTIPFHDGPDTDNEIFYRSDKVSFVSASYIPTALRDIAEYIVHIIGTVDTLRIYSLHLKASSGSTNEQLRLAEATILRNYLNNLPQGTKFCLVGDYNIYRSDEPALQKLIGSEADNDGRAKDPLNAVGAWNNNSAFRFIHTQSTRVRAFGGGSTGGLDDRFDIMLTSYALDSNIITSSYTAYGNDGNHFNDSINRLPNGAVPDSVANALHYTSDHLPIYADYQFQNAVQSPPGSFALLSPIDNAGDQLLGGVLSWQTSANAVNYDVYLDQNNPPTTLVSSNQTGTSFSYSVPLYSSTYYWKVIAKNPVGNTSADGAPWKFTTVGPPPATFVLLAPPDQAANQSTDGMLVWSSSQNSMTYDIYLDTINPPVALVVSDVIDTAYAYSGLSLGQTYYWNVVARNQNGSTVASNAPWSFTTVGTPPGTFILLAPPDQTTNQPTDGMLVWSSSQNSITYDIYLDTINPPVTLVVSDVGDTAYAYSGLSFGQRYYWKVVARNQNGSTVASNAPWWFTVEDVPPVTVTLNVQKGWNVLAIPLVVSDTRKSALFPQAISSAFAYVPGSGYTQQDTLTDGSGYWVKFDSAQAITISGIERSLDTVDVAEGWNIVCSMVYQVPASNVSSVPTDIIQSRFFGYDRGYHPADTLLSGKGYWVKTQAAGKLIFSQ